MITLRGWCENNFIVYSKIYIKVPVKKSIKCCKKSFVNSLDKRIRSEYHFTKMLLHLLATDIWLALIGQK